MSGEALTDVRVPIGLLFAALGGIVMVYGLMTAGNAAMYERSQGVNINLWWGAVMLAFGLVLYAFARRAAARDGGPR